MKSRKKQDAPEEILESRIEKIHMRREWRNFFLECAVAVAAVYAVFHFVIGIAFVSGSSMIPSLRDGEVVLFYRLDQTYQADDIVIIHKENGVEYIKRIVAEPGDVVDITEDGALLVNGETETRTVYGKTYAAYEEVSYPYTVPEDNYFVLGDNRENSRDSRSFGAVETKEVTGRVLFYFGAE